MAKKSKTALAPEVSTGKLLRYLAWTLLAAGCVLVGLSLASYDPADPLPAGWVGGPVAPVNDPPRNWIGVIGATVAHKAYLMVGPGAWIFMAGWLALVVALARRRRITQPVLRVLGVLIMTVAVSAIAGMGFASLSAVAERPMPGGSLVAFFVNHELRLRFNTLGTMIMLGVGFWVGAILAADQIVLAIPRWIAQAYGLVPKPSARPVLAGAATALRGVGQMLKSEERTGGGGAAAPLDGPVDEDAAGVPRVRNRRIQPRAHADFLDEREIPAQLDDADDESESIDRDSIDQDSFDEAPPPAKSAGREASVDDDGPAADAPGAYLAERNGGSTPFDPEALRAKIRKLPVNFAPRGKTSAGAAQPREIDLSGYRFPGPDLLVEPESNFTEEMERIVRDQAVQLEEALQQYRIEGEVVGIDSGPVITLYEVRLAPGTKVSALSAVSSDLARALKAPNIRIVPNLIGKDTVGVEVPNLKKEKVRLKELMNADADNVRKMALPMFLGKDASGNPLNADLASMPHMLIAGTTGSGKSVCMNSIIMSFLLTKRPDELKMVLVDPKMVEMSMFKDIPHLMCPVVTEMSKAAAILEWAVNKMDERYELLAEAGVRDVASYNALSWEELKERFQPSNEEEEARIPRKLYYIVFIIDELADLMMTNKEVEGFIVRIAQKARAVGLHLILATQRPQANVVTGLIKSNMPCRVSFKVASGMDSRIVLDQKGAELLLGQGDMLYLSPRTSKLIRAQGTLVDDKEIRGCVKFLKEIAEQNFEPQLVQIRSANADVDEEAAKDPLFEEAVKVVLQTRRGSVSLLQRRLTIGYSRASRLIEAMASAGILGDYKGSQARETVITIDEWEAMKAQAAADAAALDGGEGADGSGSGGGGEGVANFEANGGNDTDWANDGDDDDDSGGVPNEMDGEFRR